MTTKQIAIKLAKEILKGRIIYFDYKSYDNQEDYPHIIVNGERYDIDSVKLSKHGEYMECNGDYKGTGVDYTFGISFIELTEDELEEIGIPALLHDIYYETDESVELGDFEDDFLAES
jgi:hypothetical protein